MYFLEHISILICNTRLSNIFYVQFLYNYIPLLTFHIYIYASVDFGVYTMVKVIGTDFSAWLIGQLTLASSAADLKPSILIPGTSPETNSRMDVMPVPIVKSTSARVLMRVGGVPLQERKFKFINFINTFGILKINYTR